MVTKPIEASYFYNIRLILAKNHMVTKLSLIYSRSIVGLILAKNHMVTKLLEVNKCLLSSLILAKNHMVTKPQIHVTIYLKIIKY